MLFGLEAVLAVVETEPMVVAAARFDGMTILAADVQLADMPGICDRPVLGVQY